MSIPAPEPHSSAEGPRPPRSPRPVISQRDLRNNNAEIMRAVEQGQEFTVTRNGTPVAVVMPFRRYDKEQSIHRGRLAKRAQKPLDLDSIVPVTGGPSSEELLADLRDER